MFQLSANAWPEASRAWAKQQCFYVISKNPQVSSKLATAFFNMMCDPYDCNGHGTCSFGTYAFLNLALRFCQWHHHVIYYF